MTRGTLKNQKEFIKYLLNLALCLQGVEEFVKQGALLK